MFICRKKLEAQQPEFLRRKADTLEKIMNTERKLGIELTVTEEEVEGYRLHSRLTIHQVTKQKKIHQVTKSMSTSKSG